MVGVKQAGELAVQSFVAGDQFVGERQSRHQTALFQPKNRAKRTRKEYAFHSRKGDDAFGKFGTINPFQSPLRLFLYARNRVDGAQQVVLLGGVSNVGIDQQRVGFGVDILHRDLETVEALGFGVLHFAEEVDRQVFVHDAVGSRKKGQNVRNKMPLVVGQVVPILHVLTQVDFLRRPERRLVAFVHVPDVLVLDGKKNKPQRIFGQERLLRHGAYL